MLQAREEGLTGPAILLLILGLGVVAWISARAKASRLQAGGTARLHSRPNYHGWYVTLWTILPACLFLIIWSNVTPGRSEEHTSELQSLMRISYAVFCLKQNN